MTRIFFSLTLVLALVAFAGCGGEESNKTTGSSCAADGDCSGGVCFDSKCHSTCTAQADCGDDQLCVHGTTASGAAADFCNVAASYSGCQGDEDCDMLVAGPCDTILCDTNNGLCGFTHVEYGTPCEIEGTMGHCKSGLCEVEARDEDVVSDRDSGGPLPDAVVAQDTTTPENCVTESDPPELTPWSGEGEVVQVTVIYEPEAKIVQALPGFNQDETITIDKRMFGDVVEYAVTTGSAWAMIEVSDGELQQMEGWSEWMGFRLDAEIWVKVQQESGSSVTITFIVGEDGVTVINACWDDAALAN